MEQVKALFVSNWKTSFTGTLMIGAGVASILHMTIAGVEIHGDPMTLITGGLGLIFAKDFNTSGAK